MQEHTDYFISEIDDQLFHVTLADGAVFVLEPDDGAAPASGSAGAGWRWRYYDDPGLRKVSVGGFASKEACLAGLFAYLRADAAA